ncbi:MAG: DNA polymerase III subunit gamma/tau [Chloroflexota bacterium]|nr:DNA polymerase III subunit gamma/tau [Chloroflexota bacterium]
MDAEKPAMQTLYRVYRPTTFDADELVGQEHITRTLKSAIRQGRLAHAYLFCGPRGTGKTSTARLLAKAANCLNPDPDSRPCNQCDACRAIVEGRTMDLIEIDAASNRGIDEIRQLRETVQFNPSQLRYRFYIIDECHQLTPAAWNAFLKTLEEPPPHAKFVLCTTEPEKLLDTVASRCQRFDFHRIPVTAMTGLMQRICTREGLIASDDALAAIARQATGSMRDALSLLDTLASYGSSGDGITLETVRAVLGAGSNERVLAIIDALAARDAGAGIAAINAASESGVEPGVLTGQIVAAFRALLYAAYAVPRAGEVADAAIQERVGAFAPAEVAYITKLFSQVEFRLKHTAYGHLPLELAVVDAVLMRSGQSVPIPQPMQSIPAATPMTSTAPTPTPISAARPSRPPSERPMPPAAEPETPPVALRPDRFRPERDNTPAPPSPIVVAASATPIPTGGDLTVERLHEVWGRIKQGVKMEGSAKTRAILNDVDPHEVRGNLIVLATAGKFYYDHMIQDETRLLLEKVIGPLVGQPVRVTCELIGNRPAVVSAQNGRPLRPIASSTPPPMEIIAPIPPPATVEPPPPSNGASVTPPPITIPAITPDEANAHIQRLANLFDAQILDDDEAPPFPEQ